MLTSRLNIRYNYIFAFGHICSFFCDTFWFVVPNRYSMTVPNLSRDAPIAQVFYPIVINFFKMLRQDFYFSIAHGFEHEFFQGFIFTRGDALVYVHKPLFHYLWFNDSAGAFGGGYSVYIIFIDRYE